MKYMLILLSFLCFSRLDAQNVNLSWAKQIGGSSYDESRSMAVDANGNVYTTGTFIGTVDFDPGAGIFNITSLGGKDIFISKLDANGNFVWAKNIGGAGGGIESFGIALDAAGNIGIVGYFFNTIDFDPGVNEYLANSYDEEIFITKLSNSGEFIWAKFMVNQIFFMGSEGFSICFDAAGNVYTTGTFWQGRVDFDPGPDVYYLNTALSSIFISKLDAAGNFVWAKDFSSDDLNDYSSGFSIVADVAGNVFTTGQFAGTSDFDPGSGTFLLDANGAPDVFISKLDINGDFVWAKSLGGTGVDRANSIAVDLQGNVLTTGMFTGTADFDPGADLAILNSFNNSADVFISKLDASGNFVWAKRVGEGGFDEGRSIAVDANENVYITGSYQGMVDFDPGPRIFNISAVGGKDVFIGKLNTAGNFAGANSIGGPFDDIGYSILVNPTYDIYITGSFRDIADLDPGSNSLYFTSAGETDIFIVKLSQGTIVPVLLTKISAQQVNAGVQVNWEVQQEINIDRYEVERSPDGQHFINIGKVAATANSNIPKNYSLVDPASLTGINYYRIKIIEPGRTAYSPIVKVVLHTVTENMVNIFPNPCVGNVIHVQMNLPKGNYQIRVWNNLGQQIFAKQVNHAGGFAVENIETLRTMAAGVYQIEVCGEGVNISRKVIRK